MTQIILAGAGHGNINILKALASKPLAHTSITLITNHPRQFYSGMLSAHLEGIYAEEDISFHVQELCERAQVRCILATILSIDADDKLITTSQGTFFFDILSMNLGSSPKKSFEIDPRRAVYVKPLPEVLRLKRMLEEDDELKLTPKRMLIIGAGATGVELSLALKKSFPKLEITLIEKHQSLLKNFSKETTKKVKKRLIEQGISYSTFESLLAVHEHVIETTKTWRPYDYLVLSTGFTGPRIAYRGFQLTEENFILVDQYLRAREKILAMGDMITLKEAPRTPKTGVFAIRQASVLYHNLRALVEEQPLKPYRPQKNYLQILNAGSKNAILSRGPLTLTGKLPWVIKDAIDRHYMK